MKPVLVTVSSRARPELLWAMASDFANASGRIAGITKVQMLTPDPVGEGTKFREWRGRQAVDMEVFRWTPPTSYCLRGVALGTEFVSEIRCVPEGDGTRLEMEIRARALNFAARLLSPLLALMAKLMVKSCAKDLRDIAAAAERQA